MNNQLSKQTLASLFELYFKIKPTEMVQLPLSGSERIYFRIKNGDTSSIGVFNPDIKENEAFFSFTKTFLDSGIRVPSIFAVAPDQMHYMISDLGIETLYKRLLIKKEEKSCSYKICIIKQVLSDLLKIQIEGGKNIDFKKCYPRQAFDKQSIMWDLNYFKYDFLKLTKTIFDEQLLENDFENLANYLLLAPADFFMHRDFQSRNIMMIDDKPWFIDYQGGRHGPLQYDLASLLFSPKTGLNEIQREVMLEYYLNLLEIYTPVNREEFINFYYSFVLIRILQALGAYGYRGIFEQKPNFRNSIPSAIANLNYILEKNLIKIELPEIFRIIDRLVKSEWSVKFELPEDKLTLRITSFSYKKGIPTDPSENGGGFVFDCRGLPNPGRLKEYQQLTGLDQPVADFLEQHKEVNDFQQKVREIVSISIEEYLARNFKHLTVNFGCTGGQHRSVYHAQIFAEWVKNNYPVNVVLIHTEEKNHPDNGKKKM